MHVPEEAMTNQRKHGLFLELDLRGYRVKSKDVVFFVYRGKPQKKSKFGELRISQGAVVWRSRAQSIGRKLNWTRLDQLFMSFGRREERRKPNARKSVSRRARA